MVTPEAPVKAVNNAQVTNATNARPPGIQFKNTRVSRTSRSDVLLFPIKYPAKVKNGRASNSGASAIR
jgi:hypothetical protein